MDSSRRALGVCVVGSFDVIGGRGGSFDVLRGCFYVLGFWGLCLGWM